MVIWSVQSDIFFRVLLLFCICCRWEGAGRGEYFTDDGCLIWGVGGGGGGRGLVKNVNFHECNTHGKGRRFRIVLYASLPIVRKVDSSIHGMNLYPLDSAIHLLNNRGLVNKGLFIRPKRNIFLRANAGSPEWARWVHLARWGSQSEHIFRFILPAHEFCHIIGTVKIEVTPQVHFA